MRKRYLHDCYGEKDVFWDRTWDGDWREKCVAPAPVRQELVRRVARYVKPRMLLLEGGCGDGRYVRYFTDLGYRTIGVDFARATVRRINQLMPNLDVRLGDIRHLEFPDGYFDAYYSGGVIEHFEDGVGPQLAEAYRVLRNGGYFFVTVPHMNWTRRCAAMFCSTRRKLDLDGRDSFHEEGLREFRVQEAPAGFHFHEHVFLSTEMRRFLTVHGFLILEEMCFLPASGLRDIALYRRLVGVDRQERTILNRGFALPLRCVRSIEERESFGDGVVGSVLGAAFGHMKLYVCRAEK